MSERVALLRKKLKLTQEEFVEGLGITQSALSLIENGGNPSIDTIKAISMKYSISTDWLMSGTEPMEQNKEVNSSEFISNAHQVYGPTKGNNIIYVPLFAYGGFLQGYSNKVYMDTLQKFSLPGIHGEHFAFEIQGDSMAPLVKSGEVVISRKEEQLEWMVKGRAYVLQTIDGILVKYFEKIADGKVYLRSAGKDFDNPVIPLKNIKVVYLVLKVLKDFHTQMDNFEIKTK